MSDKLKQDAETTLPDEDALDANDLKNVSGGKVSMQDFHILNSGGGADNADNYGTGDENI